VTTIYENLNLAHPQGEEVLRQRILHNVTRVRLRFIAVSMFDVPKQYSASDASAAAWWYVGQG
jgi:hypothetical protein